MRNRYSFVGLKPDLIWRSRGGEAEINRRARVDRNAFEPCPGHPLDSLRALVKECRFALPPGLPPMASGLFGYMGYDMVRQMERLPDKNPDVLGVPDAIFLRPTAVAVFDSLEDSVTLITPAWPGVEADVSRHREHAGHASRLPSSCSSTARALRAHTSERCVPFLHGDVVAQRAHAGELAVDAGELSRGAGHVPVHDDGVERVVGGCGPWRVSPSEARRCATRPSTPAA